MDENETYSELEKEIFALAAKYSLKRLRVSTLNFDRDFKLGQDGNFHLVSVKAVIRVLGKTTKVPIGEDEAFQDYESAFAATKKRWSEYYRGIRANRSPEQLAAEAKRQKRYRERRKARRTAFKRQS